MDKSFLPTASIDLKATLMDSGQCFRWLETERGFAAALSGRAFLLRQGEDFSGTREEVELLADYLDLNRDYGALKGEFAAFPPVLRAFERYPGLRVLNQPAWETVVSFILSANNNIPRIRKLVFALSERFGSAIQTEVGTLFSFPGPEALARTTEEELRALGVGYRSPYLLGTARRVVEGFPLDSLRELPYEEARELLLTLPGVGDKVADCILLFGCRQASAFPVDVWVERLLGVWFGLEAGNRPALKRLARETFGPYGGLMQQFLFHAARMEQLRA